MDKFIQLNCNEEADHQANLWFAHSTWLSKKVKIFNAMKASREAAHQHDGGEPFQLLENGIAIISINGLMMKGDSFFGGVTNTIRTRNSIRQAAMDPDVKAILLNIDSGGGTVAGTMELADDVKMADRIKPTFTQISDMMASAALWVGVQSRGVFSNALGETGSIGVVSVLADFSKMMEMDGIKIHVISTGPHKGAGFFGSEITEEQIAEEQSLVNQVNEFFLKAVATGRSMPIAEVRKIADGRMFLAAKAKELGLIDGIQSLDKTVEMISKSIKSNTVSARNSNLSAEARLRLAENNL